MAGYFYPSLIFRPVSLGSPRSYSPCPRWISRGIFNFSSLDKLAACYGAGLKHHVFHRFYNWSGQCCNPYNRRLNLFPHNDFYQNPVNWEWMSLSCCHISAVNGCFENARKALPLLLTKIRTFNFSGRWLT